MGVFTYETETTSIIAPAKLFKALFLDGDNLIPKVANHAIKSAEIIEGNGGPRTIKKIASGEGSQFKYVKHRIQVSDALSEVLEISHESKIVVSTTQRVSMKSRKSKYCTMGEHEIKKEQVKGEVLEISHESKIVVSTTQRVSMKSRKSKYCTMGEHEIKKDQVKGGKEKGGKEKGGKEKSRKEKGGKEKGGNN